MLDDPPPEHQPSVVPTIIERSRTLGGVISPERSSRDMDGSRSLERAVQFRVGDAQVAYRSFCLLFSYFMYYYFFFCFLLEFMFQVT